MFRPVFNVEDFVLLHHFFLNFEKNQARENALRLWRTNCVSFWSTSLKENLEKFFPSIPNEQKKAES